MKLKVNTKNRRYDFTQKEVTSIVERKSKSHGDLLWLVLKCGDVDLARFRMDEVECILFTDV
ncbi:hypothetical protein PXD04_10370 [Methanosphaera sp. ISO3-F5]|uniref:hypothetical protein n=1 Tax=Methanosphaera sp. ISO3-F5 TaxID=1452353 RepID=UPI002B25F1C8|nr:hypothetical protein [Methanosphaera sp. ISO3-F5]WQH64095.1 hypothetical protein PXD04_10370 [Methanosphaera sp. ISO3-F5]